MSAVDEGLKISVFCALNTIEIGQNRYRLTPKEFELLVLLARHYPKTVNKGMIVNSLWQQSVNADELVTRLVADLRKKIGDSSRSPRFIETVINKGYRIIVPVELIESGAGKLSFIKKIDITKVALILLLLINLSLLLLLLFSGNSGENRFDKKNDKPGCIEQTDQ